MTSTDEQTSEMTDMPTKLMLYFTNQSSEEELKKATTLEDFSDLNRAEVNFHKNSVIFIFRDKKGVETSKVEFAFHELLLLTKTDPTAFKNASKSEKETIIFQGVISFIESLNSIWATSSIK